MVKKKIFSKAFEQTWNQILRLHESEDGTTKFWDKKILKKDFSDPKIARNI